MSVETPSRLKRRISALSISTEANLNQLAEEIERMKSLMNEAKSAFVPMRKIKEVLLKLINDSAKLIANKSAGE